MTRLSLDEINKQLALYKESLTLGGLSKCNTFQSKQLKIYLAQLDAYNLNNNESILDNSASINNDFIFNNSGSIPEALYDLISIEYNNNCNCLNVDPSAGTALLALNRKANEDFTRYSLIFKSIENPYWLYTYDHFPDELKEKITAGNYVKFENNKSSGLIVKLNDSFAYIKPKNINSIPSNASITYWWSPLNPLSEWINISCLTEAKEQATLSVKFNVPSDSTVGKVGWSLYYNGVEQARGGDSFLPGLCYLTFPEKQFRPGYYSLKASRKTRALSTSNTNQYQWNIQSEVNTLSYTPNALYL